MARMPANHTVIPAKAGTYAAWVPAFAGMTCFRGDDDAFAGMTILCGVCYIMPENFAFLKPRPSLKPLPS